MIRVVRALAASVYVAFKYVGMPIGLYIFGPNPFPAFTAFANNPMMRDDGTLLLAIITCVGWAGWGYYALGMLIEIPNRLLGLNLRIPGLGHSQMLAGLVLAAITTTTVASTIASARTAASHPVTPPLVAVATSMSSAHTSDPSEKDTVAAAKEQYVTHVVQRGETLLDLAEHYYHDPNAVMRIAEANTGIPQPDGRTLKPAETRIYPGWNLRIPTPATITGVAAHEASTPMSPASTTIYQTRSGDYLWFIAERFLGDPQRYPEIAACNPDLINDPNLIKPGWQLILPIDANDRGERAHATGHVIAQPDDDHTAPAITDPPSVEQPTGGTHDGTPPGTASDLPSAPAGQITPTAPVIASDTGADDVDETGTEQHDPAAHVALPSGGWITTGLAVALTTSLILAQVNRRRRNKPQFPIPITHTPAGPPRSDNLRVATTAGLTTLRGQLDSTEAAADHQPETISSVAITRNGTEISLHQQFAGLTAFTGPGAQAAGRAIIATALTSSIRRWGKDQAELLTDTDTITRLLNGAPIPVGIQRLSIAANPQAAVEALEHEVIYRNSYLAMYGNDTITDLHRDPDHDPLELAVWIGNANPHTAPRIVEAAKQGQHLGIDIFVLGQIPDQPAIHVTKDGTLTIPTGHPAHPILQHGRIATLNPADLADALTIIADATSLPPEEFASDAAAPSDGADGQDAETGEPALAEPEEQVDPQHLAPSRDQAAPVSLRVLGSPSVSTATAEHLNFGRKYAYPILTLLTAYPQGRTLEQLAYGAGIDQRPIEPGKFETPEEQEKADKAYAKTTITGIRTAIKAAGGRDGKIHLRHEGDIYRLDPDTVEVDLWRMHAHLADANNATDDATAIAALRQAIACYKGDFAEGIDQDWANDHRNVYRRQVLDAYNKIVELTEEDEPDVALTYLHEAIEIDNINEFLYQTIMRIQGKLGRIDAVHRTMAILQDRLAVWNDSAEPSSATAGVFARMTTHNRATGRSGQEVGELPASNLDNIARVLALRADLG